MEAVTQEVWPLEQRVTSGHLGDPEQFLEELFATRHALLAVSNMATLGHQIYRRMSALARFVPPDCRLFVLKRGARCCEVGVGDSVNT